MMYRTTVYIGVFWDGGCYELKHRRWRWLAHLMARLHLIKYPYRAANINKIGEPTMDYRIKTETTITAQQVCDLIITAFEGGSNYWIDRAELESDHGPDELTFEAPWYATEKLYERDDWAIRIHISDSELSRLLTPDVVRYGLGKMTKEQPQHFNDILMDNSDADTADAFLQLALFGEIRYG